MYNKYNKVMLYFGLAGLLFSGYLSSIKLFSATCAFNEPCPYFLGYPACYFGFGLFLIIFIVALLGLMKKIPNQKMSKALAWVSFLGILFAGYFTIPEINILLSGTSNYSLGLPTCAYGLIFYVIILILAIKHVKK